MSEGRVGRVKEGQRGDCRGGKWRIEVWGGGKGWEKGGGGKGKRRGEGVGKEEKNEGGVEGGVGKGGGGKIRMEGERSSRGESNYKGGVRRMRGVDKEDEGKLSGKKRRGGGEDKLG